MAIRVLMVDDHQILRRALTALMTQRPGIEVVGEAADGRTAITLAAELRPDIVLMDLAMPSMNGVDATRDLLKQSPGTRVIVLSQHTDRKHVMAAMEAGARGYLSKDATADELFEAIETVLAGNTFLGNAAMRQAADEYDRSNAALSTANALSPRERQMLQLISEGRATKEAARDMAISVKTAETYRRAIMEKLQLDSVAELTKHAIREGITSLDF